MTEQVKSREAQPNIEIVKPEDECSEDSIYREHYDLDEILPRQGRLF